MKSLGVSLCEIRPYNNCAQDTNSREVKQVMIKTSSHDAKVPFGMEIPYGHRNKFIL